MSFWAKVQHDISENLGQSFFVRSHQQHGYGCLGPTVLFGGFPPRFYAAYEDLWPLDRGFTMRETLYNLYHVLNHFNLFGASYRSQTHNMLIRLIGELHG